ncbi:MAG: DUF4290 domain-containing protein [Bacteroidales bacterium]|nr:DUF4290 domain-containing protein [Bacteroidales bacterium]
MDYNTRRNMLILPEYGRNIQKMVEHATSLENREERNKAVNEIINVMGNMNPHLRDVNDFKHKLWDQVAQMANFEIDLDSPYPTPKKETFTAKPNIIPYLHNNLKYRYLGRTIVQLIKAASEFEEGEKKTELIKIITNHMKKSYIMWNKDTVDDSVIFEKLSELSNGKLKVEGDAKLTETKDIFGKKRKKKKIVFEKVKKQ